MIATKNWRRPRQISLYSKITKAILTACSVLVISCTNQHIFFVSCTGSSEDETISSRASKADSANKLFSQGKLGFLCTVSIWPMKWRHASFAEYKEKAPLSVVCYITSCHCSATLFSFWIVSHLSERWLPHTSTSTCYCGYWITLHSISVRSLYELRVVHSCLLSVLFSIEFI